MNVLVSGSSGLIGSALVSLLEERKHRVIRLVRTSPPNGSGAIAWDPVAGTVEKTRLEGMDAVVHLAGENIATRRWTKSRKARIWDSRVKGTHHLCRALAQLSHPPRVLISASAVGYYGNRGDEILDESSASGSGFLAELCRYWEAATRPAAEVGVRVVLLRFGVVFSPAGGALAKMLPPFRLGLGGVIGSGNQFCSWIAIEDAVEIIRQAIEDERFQGPVNAVSPHPVTNRELTKTLGRLLHRPTICPLPAFVARAAFGKLADELLLAGARVRPAYLQKMGFPFRYPDLESALRRHLAGRISP